MGEPMPSPPGRAPTADRDAAGAPAVGGHVDSDVDMVDGAAPADRAAAFVSLLVRATGTSSMSPLLEHRDAKIRVTHVEGRGNTGTVGGWRPAGARQEPVR